MERLNKEP